MQVPFLVATADGSNTLFQPEVGEHYHSKHGALQESKHVFLESGLGYFLVQNPQSFVRILEVGLGTGLNFLLTADYAAKKSLQLDYTAIEAYPLSETLLAQTGYDQFVEAAIWEGFLAKYKATFTTPTAICPGINLSVVKSLLANFEMQGQVDVIYFDAFAAIHQPEMWTDEALARVCKYLKPSGVFVTYAITGNLK
ncbi:MAG: tRNA (5-methylaminomethyl-2-thiouridine)(34)-methyltransferase MnmD, partial [Sphingobacteriaceae bacterium]